MHEIIIYEIFKEIFFCAQHISSGDVTFGEHIKTALDCQIKSCRIFMIHEFSAEFFSQSERFFDTCLDFSQIKSFDGIQGRVEILEFGMGIEP